MPQERPRVFAELQALVFSAWQRGHFIPGLEEQANRSLFLILTDRPHTAGDRVGSGRSIERQLVGKLATELDRLVVAGRVASPASA